MSPFLKKKLLLCTSAGYTIFVIEGDLPPCEADQLLSLVPIQSDKDATKRKPLKSREHHSKSTSSREKQSSKNDDNFAFELATALSASMVSQSDSKHQDDDLSMATALSESMQGRYDVDAHLDDRKKGKVNTHTSLI